MSPAPLSDTSALFNNQPSQRKVVLEGERTWQGLPAPEPPRPKAPPSACVDSRSEARGATVLKNGIAASSAFGGLLAMTEEIFTTP